MKVVHVWNTAGVACILAKWLRKQGIQSRVISKGLSVHDPFHYLDYYGEVPVYTSNNTVFMDNVNSLIQNANIVHLHSVPELIAPMKKKGKKVVMHYHGSELVLKGVTTDNPDKILLSSPNLLDYCPEGTVIPNPVDTELFHDIGKRGDKWLMFKIRYLDMGFIENYLGTEFSSREVIDRDANPMLYKHMPEILQKYCGYIDIKFDKDYGHLVKVPSRTALEALACGLPVVNWEKKIVRGLPEEHKPENVVKQLIGIYKELV
jgi:hypothetical protein